MSVARSRSGVGNAAKHYKSRPSAETKAALDEARRELAAAKLEAAIKTAVDAAPPLHPETLGRLAVLLQGPRTSA